jgi:DNA modification methylase
MTFVLHPGDCLDPVTGLASLADRSVDHVICDPPYSQHVHAKSRAGASPKRARDNDGDGRGMHGRSRDLGFDHLTTEVREQIAAHCARLARRWVLAFCDDESAHLWRTSLESAGLEYVRTGHWHKIGGTPQFTGDRPGVAVEAIVIAHQPGRKRWHGGGRAAFWPCPIVLDRGAGEQRVHTTQKPLDLMTALVRDFTDHGETILDPFAGSGTTGVAAIQLGRAFVGWERKPEYHAVATSRLTAAREQPGLALGRKVRPPKTVEMFGGEQHEKQHEHPAEPVKNLPQSAELNGVPT